LAGVILVIASGPKSPAAMTIDAILQQMLQN
jgi:hypothetical protein